MKSTKDPISDTVKSKAVHVCDSGKSAKVLIHVTKYLWKPMYMNWLQTLYDVLCRIKSGYLSLYENFNAINTLCLFFTVQLCCTGSSFGIVYRCILLIHWGVQLILAYSWARPALLVVGKGRGEMCFFLLFLHLHSCSSFFPVPLFHLLYSLFYLFSPFLWETTQNDPQGLTCR